MLPLAPSGRFSVIKDLNLNFALKMSVAIFHAKVRRLHLSDFATKRQKRIPGEEGTLRHSANLMKSKSKFPVFLDKIPLSSSFSLAKRTKQR